ncbi:uncharacterized protein LOC110702423 [Chenopodium quinoa]|uniref:Mitochondrial carrier protein n=1 Tax=Chenopodium quinoa TaxID=63459 RepID=A0A803LQH2_CHEQI|nr:uncharacterized protein LOC110702423 [Chenopodium quinoa]XP_021735816.1 uncharacterized protein LOC110702423 [Chenopodium quinoa]
MVKYYKTSSHGQQSIKFGTKPLKGPNIEIADFADGSAVQISSIDNKHARENLTLQSPEILSTSELISAVGQVWDCASRSLARYQPKASFDCSGTVCQKENDSRLLVDNDDFGFINVIGNGCLDVDLNSSHYFSCIVQQSLKFTRAAQRIHCNPCNDQFVENFFWQIGDESSNKPEVRLKEKNLADVGTLYNIMKTYGWMSQVSVSPKHLMSAYGEVKKIVEAFTSKGAVRHCSPVSGMNSSSAGTENLDMCVDRPNLKDLESRGSDEVIMCTDNLLHGVRKEQFAANMPTDLSFGLHLDYHVSTSAPDCTQEPNELDVDGNFWPENEMRQCENINIQENHQSESCPAVTNKPHPLLAKQEHAVSGALAGIAVSVCLHPIDTVKTIVQSCQPGQKSICYIGRSVLSERGLPGLYRGITSNITASAPISAIYTFTYESVKEFMLPSLAKEYHSVAHCTAGACASIATSVVFTPSERIKQQMQVNSKYQNCWNAVQRIINTGGLRSLYAGWGAVLCRNIPHSIIKFYTYESLKQMLMSSHPPTKLPSTLQTLLCGGLAGSTAALFSTPFDVVKTRLQTQMPGSTQRYHSIFNTLQDICEHEGVRGLYRGLIPRLAMYMSQGALFFASYEFLKGFLSPELRQHKSEMLQHKQDSKEANDNTLLSV